jgi:hypothetical protein
MSRNRVIFNFPGFIGFVNLTASVLAIGLIGASYLSAVGRLAGVA